MRGTLSLSWGPYGGFYLHPRRICLGWVAITLIPDVEIDDMMAAWADRLDILELPCNGENPSELYISRTDPDWYWCGQCDGRARLRERHDGSEGS